MSAPRARVFALMPSTVLPVVLLCSGPPSAAAPALPPACDAGAQDAPTAEEGSFERFLARARAERERVHAELAPRVRALLDRAAEASPGPGPELLEELVSLGTEATPLLVERLAPPEPPAGDGAGPAPGSDVGSDVGSGADSGAASGSDAEPPPEPGLDPRGERLANFVAEALVRMDPQPVAGRLLELLEEGSPPTRLRAARVLSAIPDNPAVSAALRSTYDSSRGELRTACFEALITLGGADVQELLVEVLGGYDTGLAQTALFALARTANAEAAPAVASVLSSPTRAARMATGLVAYYRAVPDAVDGEVTDSMVELAVRASSSDVQLLLLGALPELKPSLASTRRRLEPLVDSKDKDLREAALKALALLGDRGARRDLLEPYDEKVDRNKRWSQAYARRADLLLEIRDYDDAIRDYKRALDFGKNDPNLDEDVYLGLARCYALKERYRDAAEWLRRAPISLRQLRALADEPTFAGLLASRWGPEAFALEERR